MTCHSQILFQQLTYVLPTGVVVFDSLDGVFSPAKIGLIGKNGVGKSTLLKLITQEWTPASGNLTVRGSLAYCPQNYSVNAQDTVVDVLGVENIEISHEIKISIPETKVPQGKMILEMEEVTFAYPDSKPIIANSNLKIQGPERIGIVGKNGSGKTTLVKLILNELIPASGKIYVGTPRVRYLEQNATTLNPTLSILENFKLLNPECTENDSRAALAQFLFRNTAALKLVKELSGGERLRALLACVLMGKNLPQLLILDEPTNHLDLVSIESIESALNCYEGALIVISHDGKFLNNINILDIKYS
jgi:ATPase subunit of ABC transporter with duplicated ATPase domains